MSPDSLHIRNARIWTGEAGCGGPTAGSISIDRGKIAPVSRDATDNARAAQVRSIDAEEKVVTPGLIDAHMHLLMGGASLELLDLSHVKSRDEFEAAVSKRHVEMNPDEWLIARGWSQENWGGEFPDKSWLRSAGHRPVVCYRMDMHGAVVNDAVLQRLDMTNDPIGGRIERDAAGNPTGLLMEAAVWQLVNPLVPKPNAQTRRRHLLNAQRHMHSLGLTGAGLMEYASDVRDMFMPLRDQLTLRCRVTLLDRPVNPPIEDFDFSFGRDFPNDESLAVIGHKTFIDGTLGSRTARMLRDYADDPGNRGMLVELAAHGLLNDWAQHVASLGLSPSMHAIGDEAVRLALEAIESIQNPKSKIDNAIPPRIEHAQQIDIDDIHRFRGRIASMQPLHKADDCRYVRQRLGDDRCRGTFAFRSLLDAGAILAFGSDWPVVSCDPLRGIRAAVTGLTFDNVVFAPEQNLTVEQALQAYTAGAAQALGMADAGVLKPGAPGDMVMWNRDPFTADWTNHPPRIVMTIAGGKVVYDAMADLPCPTASPHQNAPAAKADNPSRR